MAYHNGRKFSTRDNDNDAWSDNCAQAQAGAWWYMKCHRSTLNGRYFNAAFVHVQGIQWWHWKRACTTLKFTEMKTRRNN